MAKKDKATPEADGEAPKSGKGKLIIIIVVVFLVALGAGGGAAWYFLQGAAPAQETAEAEPPKPSRGPARYVDFDPDFTVNLDSGGNARFLQVALAALTYYDETEEALKNHMPQLRSSLITLFGNQVGDSLATLEGKEQLRTDALAEITRVLESTGEDDVRIGQIFFTKFIVQ